MAIVPETVRIQPIPGMLINLKSSARCLKRGGVLKKIEVRLAESTMQNIADYIISYAKQPLNAEQKQNNLKTFLTYNARHKTISVTKKLQLIRIHPRNT